MIARKMVVSITALFLLMLSVVASAATLYPYGEWGFGKDNILFRGNLEKSGLQGVDERWSIKHRHDLRFYNVNTGQYTPGENEYFQTVQYDIQPNIDEPDDIFNRKSGYHVVPLDEELIKDLATKANGNPDYVWGRINSLYAQAESSPKMWVSLNPNDPNSPNKLYAYKVNGQPYLNIGAVFYLSGGGDPQMVENQGGDGINSPAFHTTAKITNWPVIHEFKQNPDGSIGIKATAYSIFDTAIIGRLTVNGDPNLSKEYFRKSTPVSNHSVTYEGIIPLSQIAGLTGGQDKLTLKVSDPFGRSVEQTITLNQENTCQPILVYNKETHPKTDIYFSETVKDFGGVIQWGLEFDPNQCVVFDSVAGHGDYYTPGKVAKVDGRYFYTMNLWKYWIYQTDGGFRLVNQSTDSRELVFYLMDSSTGQRVQTVTIGKGKSVNVSLPVKDFSGRYYLYSPAPTEIKGDWNPNDTTYRGLPAKTQATYPSELVAPIQQLVEASQ